MNTKTLNIQLSRRSLLAAAGLASGAFALAGCTSSSGSEGSSGSSAAETGRTEAVSLRYGYPATNNDALTGLVGLANSLGYLEEELAEVNASFETVPFSKAGPAVSAALEAGEVDMGIMGEVPSLSARASGAETTVLAVTYQNDYVDVVVPDESDIETLDDLRGKTIAVQTGSYMQRILYQILEDAGIGTDEVELANMAEVDAATAIAAGSVDAAPLPSPKSLTLQFSGDAKLIYSSDGVEAQRSVGTTLARTAFVEEYPDVLVAFFKGVIRAEDYIDQNGVDVLRQEIIDAGTDEAIVDAAYDDEDFVTSLSTPDERVDLLQSIADLMLDYGIIETAVDVYEWFDGSLYKEAAEASA